MRCLPTDRTTSIDAVVLDKLAESPAASMFLKRLNEIINSLPKRLAAV